MRYLLDIYKKNMEVRLPPFFQYIKTVRSVSQHLAYKTLQRTIFFFYHCYLIS